MGCSRHRMVRFTLVNFLKKLKRNPVQGRYIPALDGLRFLAILGVVLFHGWILHQLLHLLPIQTQDTPWNHTNILLVTLLVFLVNIPFYLFIEKPFM